MAELKSILEVNDFTIHLETSTDVGRKLSRSEIEQILTDNGVTLPLTRDVGFFISDSADHYFHVTFLSSIDIYAQLRLVGV